jgi:hypothetical protein
MELSEGKRVLQTAAVGWQSCDSHDVVRLLHDQKDGRFLSKLRSVDGWW